MGTGARTLAPGPCAQMDGEDDAAVCQEPPPPPCVGILCPTKGGFPWWLFIILGIVLSIGGVFVGGRKVRS